jgi:hypothetical protein
VQQTSSATGLGSLEASRGGRNVVTDCFMDGTLDLIQGEITDKCQPWDGNSWTGNSWTGNSWTGNSWTGNSWTGNSWTGNSWTGNSWTGNSWTGNSWTSAEYEDTLDSDFLTAFWGGRPAWTQHIAGERSEPRPVATRNLA